MTPQLPASSVRTRCGNNHALANQHRSWSKCWRLGGGHGRRLVGNSGQFFTAGCRAYHHRIAKSSPMAPLAMSFAEMRAAGMSSPSCSVRARSCGLSRSSSRQAQGTLSLSRSATMQVGDVIFLSLFYHRRGLLYPSFGGVQGARRLLCHAPPLHRRSRAKFIARAEMFDSLSNSLQKASALHPLAPAGRRWLNVQDSSHLSRFSGVVEAEERERAKRN